MDVSAHVQISLTFEQLCERVQDGTVDEDVLDLSLHHVVATHAHCAHTLINVGRASHVKTLLHELIDRNVRARATWSNTNTRSDAMRVILMETQ